MWLWHRQLLLIRTSNFLPTALQLSLTSLKRRVKAWKWCTQGLLAIIKASIKCFNAVCSIHRVINHRASRAAAFKEPVATMGALNFFFLSLKVRTEDLNCEVWIWAKKKTVYLHVYVSWYIEEYHMHTRPLNCSQIFTSFVFCWRLGHVDTHKHTHCRCACSHPHLPPSWHHIDQPLVTLW